jgi:hypothetical protein
MTNVCLQSMNRPIPLFDLGDKWIVALAWLFVVVASLGTQFVDFVVAASIYVSKSDN